MQTSFIKSLLEPSQPYFWLFITTLFVAITSLAIIFNFSLIVAPALSLILAAMALIRKPLPLLGLLVIIRMALDYLSETIRIHLNDKTSLSLSQILGVFLLSISIVLFIVYRKKLWQFPVLKPFVLLIAFGLCSSLWSIAPSASLQEIARLISIFSISFLAYISITENADVKSVFSLLLLSSFLPLAEALRQVFLGIGLTDSSVDIPRIYGTFAHTNVLALYLYSMLALIVLIFFFPREKKYTADELFKRNFFLISYALLATGLLLLTYTRVAWVALFLFVFILALWRYRLLLVPLLLGPILLFLLIPSVRDRVLESFQTRPDSSIVWRQEIWHDVTAKLRLDERQLLGTGIDTFSRYAEDLRGTRFGSTDSHNDFVKFYVEGGVIGFIVFLTYLGFLAREIRKLFSLPKKYRPLAVVFATYALMLLLSSLSDNVYKDTPLQWIFFILLGALIGLRAKSIAEMNADAYTEKQKIA